MVPRIVAVLTSAVLLLGSPAAEAGILFDNGPAAAIDNIGRVNSDAYTIYDNFTLSTSSIIQGVTWEEHDSQSSGRTFYNSTDISIFNAVPSAASEVFFGNVVASRIANGSPDVFSKVGFDYSATGLTLNLAAGTYYIGIHSKFDGGEQSTWDLAAGSSSSLFGRYQTSNPPDAGTFYVNEDSVFQILGTPQSDSTSDPPPTSAPEPATLVIVSLLLGVCGRRRATEISG